MSWGKVILVNLFSFSGESADSGESEKRQGVT